MRIVITGGNSGIGRATAIHLAREGHDVVATARTPDRATKLMETTRSEGLPVVVERLDVSSDDSVRACFAEIAAEALLSARERMTDADFLGLATTDDAVYRELWRRSFDIDLTPGWAGGRA